MSNNNNELKIVEVAVNSNGVHLIGYWIAGKLVMFVTPQPYAKINSWLMCLVDGEFPRLKCVRQDIADTLETVELKTYTV